MLHNAALIDQKNIAEQLKHSAKVWPTVMLPPGKGEYRFPRCGTGDKARDRMKQMADIRADFLRQQRDLQRDFSRGQISEDLYKKQTEALKTALAERPDIQEEYYKNR